MSKIIGLALPALALAGGVVAVTTLDPRPAAASAASCIEGKEVAAQIVSENSRLERTLTGNPMPSGGKYSLEHVLTTGQDKYVTSCEADVIFENPDPKVAPNFIGRMRTHVSYTVSLTEDNMLYVKLIPNNNWILEQTQEEKSQAEERQKQREEAEAEANAQKLKEDQARAAREAEEAQEAQRQRNLEIARQKAEAEAQRDARKASLEAAQLEYQRNPGFITTKKLEIAKCIADLGCVAAFGGTEAAVRDQVGRQQDRIIMEKRRLVLAQALGLATERHDVQGIADIRRELENLGKSGGESQQALGEAINEEKKQPDENINQNVPSPPGNVLTPTLPEVLRMSCYPASNAAPYEVSYNVHTRIGSITNDGSPGRKYYSHSVANNERLHVYYVNMTAPGQTRTVYLAFNYSSIDRGASGLRIVDGAQDSRDPCAFHAN